MEFCSISLTPPTSNRFADDLKKFCAFSCLQEIHQIGAVLRSGEYRPRETAPVPHGAGASAQPHPHNPRKQQKDPAAAGSGERFRGGKWRTVRDSNPRDGSPPTHFPGVRLRPLGQLSLRHSLSGETWRRKGLDGSIHQGDRHAAVLATLLFDAANLHPADLGRAGHMSAAAGLQIDLRRALPYPHQPHPALPHRRLD